MAALACEALGLVPHCPGVAQALGESWRVQSAGGRPALLQRGLLRPPVPRARPGGTRAPESPQGARLPPPAPKERAATPMRPDRKEARAHVTGLAERPWGCGVCSGAGHGTACSASPGALFFTANWTFRSERNNHSPRRRGLAVNADMTHNVTLPVKGIPAPGLGSRPTPRFFLIMEVISL